MLIDVNGVTLYYEKRGQGAPLVLLHGNGESHRIFDGLCARLEPDFATYAIDTRGHGESTKVKALSYADMARDVIEFIEKLELEKPVLYGFSDGGIIGLLVAIMRPELLGRLICSGANVTPEGLRPGFRSFCRVCWFFSRSPLFKMMLTEPHISAESLSTITVPTVLIAGSRDLITEEHTRYIAENVPGAVLKILPGESHESYVLNNDKLYEVLKPYLFG